MNNQVAKGLKLHEIAADCPVELLKVLVNGGIDRKAVDDQGRTCVDRLWELGLFAKAVEYEKLGFCGVKPKPVS